jgi:hypothetical protein
VSSFGRIVETLPPPYTVEEPSTLGQVLGTLSLEPEAYQEDLDRLRRSHWVEHVFRLVDLERLAALVGVTRLSWEDLRTFRARLLALVAARLGGAVDPGSVKRFVFDYLTRGQDALESVFVPGLRRGTDPEEGFRPREDAPLFRPLALVENPERLRRSSSLSAVGGRVPYLFRWEEENRGLEETEATFTVTGFPGGATAVPLVANLTTGDLIGYAGVLPVGARLRLDSAGGEDPRSALVTLDGEEVQGLGFSVSGFRMGQPFAPEDLDPEPLLPRMARGPNRLVYLSVGLFDVRGLDRVFYAIADDRLRQGVFDQTGFDDALFRIGATARLEMEWTEVEPASFEVHVPRYVVVQSPEVAGTDPQLYRELGDALRTTVGEVRAAGVRADVKFIPFVETQGQRVRARLPWVVVPPEAGPTGVVAEASVGARFGQSALGETRFE